jgi:hypothetical protein
MRTQRIVLCVPDAYSGQHPPYGDVDGHRGLLQALPGQADLRLLQRSGVDVAEHDPAPSSPSRSAMARPSPHADPVTIALRPLQQSHAGTLWGLRLPQAGRIRAPGTVTS